MNARKRLKSSAGWLAGAAGLCWLAARSRATIVTFHRVTDDLPEDGITCGASKFQDFCEFFQRHFDVMPLSEQIARANAGIRIGGTLSITFDDGYLDNAEVAVPILEKVGVPATFFLTTGFVGSRAVPFWDQGLMRPAGWMSWDNVRSLAARGFEMGNHTDTHLDMGTAEIESIRRDLTTADAKLTQELGTPSRLFAYPFGGRAQITRPARELVRELGFTCCVSCYGGLNSTLPDPFHLARVGIAEWFASPGQFALEFALGRV